MLIIILLVADVANFQINENTVIYVNKFLSPPPPSLRSATDHILANILEEYPNQGILKTCRIIKPTIH